MKKFKAIPIFIYLANLGVILYFWWLGSGSLFGSGPNAVLLAIGRLSGLLGMYSLIVQFTLISRGRWLEAKFGLDKLTRYHHWNGLATISLIILHVGFIIKSYSGIASISSMEQYKLFLTSYRFVALAFVGYLILLVSVFMSLVIVKRRLRYETWYYIHLLNYISILSVFWHQIANGGDFLANPVFKYYWIVLYFSALGNLFIFRFFRPLYLYRKHKFQVAKIVRETPSTISIYITGENLDKFKYKAGQFAKWWFLAPGFKRESHPFTISVEPNGKYLRLTPKNVGDFTNKLPNIPKGTKVFLDGPYGVFTSDNSNSTTILMIAGGIGITPIRAMIGELADSERHDLHLLYSARVVDELAFKKDFDVYSKNQHINVRYILSDEKKPGFLHGQLDGKKIKALVPDVLNRDVYICGPPPMMKALSAELIHLGVAKSSIHTERFSLS
jgi:predicted ferric reductase